MAVRKDPPRFSLSFRCALGSIQTLFEPDSGGNGPNSCVISRDSLYVWRSWRPLTNEVAPVIPRALVNPQSFSISLAVELTKAGERNVSHALTTHNLSAKGVLMNCPSCAIEIGQEVEYFVTLPTHPAGAPVRLHCLGHVVRRDTALDVFAVSIERHEFVSGQAATRRPS
jgi:hypothetical protein